MKPTMMLMAMFIVLFASVSNAETLKIDGCTAINSPGHYLIVNDLVNLTAETCISITSNNVILDGDGHSIQGTPQKFRTGVLIHSPYGIVNVTVRNITVENWYYGVYIKKAEDVEISFSKIANTSRHGIHVSNSTSIQIDSNRLTNNGVGISFEGGSEYIVVSNSTIEKNLDGIYIIDSSNGLFERNIIRNNWGGIWISGSFQIVISNNTIYLNKDGIWISRSDHNLISNNEIWNNENGIWIFDYSLYNTFKDNVIYENNLGLKMFNYTTFNTIYNNIFNNTINVELDNTTQNTWNASKSSGRNIIYGMVIGGNYWAESNNTGYSQICIDVDVDGICDLPYHINNKNIDYLPLTNIQVAEIVLDSINDSLEQIITKYYPFFDWRTETPTRSDVIQAVVGAVNLYFSTTDQRLKDSILNDVVLMVYLYFQL